jgi:hypothetical protein
VQRSPSNKIQFPEIINVAGKEFKEFKEEKQEDLSGANPKTKYISGGSIYICKVEKERKISEIFVGLIPGIKKKEDKDLKELSEHLKQEGRDHEFPKRHKELQRHVDDLRDSATATSVIAANIARSIFPSIAIPENILTRLPDNTPCVLSKYLPSKLEEFLSEKSLVKGKDPKKPDDWKKEGKGLPKRSELKLSSEEAKILGTLYYAALLMGHWDLINNINLTNSGYIILKDGKKCPAIVDWGNCLGVGFGGVSQDSTAFQNPEFQNPALNHSPSDADPVTGFIGATPFSSIVYPQLPRQVVTDLFDMSGNDEISISMREGFFAAHKEAQANFSKAKAGIANAIEQPLDDMKKDIEAKEKIKAKDIEETLKKEYKGADFERDPEAQAKLKTELDKMKKELEKELGFKAKLNKELFGNQGKGVTDILEGRMNSLDGIVNQLKSGKNMAEIAAAQLQKTVELQMLPPGSPSRHPEGKRMNSPKEQQQAQSPGPDEPRSPESPGSGKFGVR